MLKRAMCRGLVPYDPFINYLRAKWHVNNNREFRGASSPNITTLVAFSSSEDGAKPSENGLF